jgi:SAM-dependent methyltransferase
MEEAHNDNRWVVGAFAPYIGQSLLEIGIGHAGYYNYLPPLTSYVGLDIDATTVAEARVRYPDRQFVQADAADPALPELLAGTPIDTVLCVNVLEHIERDRETIASLLRILTPGGHLLLFVPAFRQLYTDLDRLAGHVRRYSRAEVAALVPSAGYEIARLAYFNPIGGLGWWLNGLISHRSLETKEVTGQVRLFDTWILPVSRLVDPLTSPFFGQSVVCVIRRAG